MGVDFNVCQGCSNAYCAGSEHTCENCGRSYCNQCALDADCLTYWAGEGLFCDECDEHEKLPQPKNRVLVDFALEKLGMTRSELVAEYRASIGQTATGVSCCECGTNDCDDVASNYCPLYPDQAPDHYTYDYRKAEYMSNGSVWGGKAQRYDARYQNSQGAKEPCYMRPKGCCCRCAEQDLCDKCESRGAPKNEEEDEEKEGEEEDDDLEQDEDLEQHEKQDGKRQKF